MPKQCRRTNKSDANAAIGNKNDNFDLKPWREEKGAISTSNIIHTCEREEKKSNNKK